MGKQDGRPRRNHDDAIRDAQASGAVVQLCANWDLGVLRGVQGSDAEHEVAWALTPARARQLAASLLRAANTCEPPGSMAEAVRRTVVQQQVERGTEAEQVAAQTQIDPAEPRLPFREYDRRRTARFLSQERERLQGELAAAQEQLSLLGIDRIPERVRLEMQVQTLTATLQSPLLAGVPVEPTTGPFDTEPFEALAGTFGIGGALHVVGYCCGSCFHFHGAGYSYGSYREWPDEREVAFAREQAERCCQCHYCDAPVTQADKERDHNDRDAPSLRQCCSGCYEPERAQALAWAARCKAAADAETVLHDAALALALDRDAAVLLEERMSAISEKYFCAGWLNGLEHDLWPMLQGGSRDFGLGEVTEAEVDDLRRLHARAGGWWAWFEGSAEHATPDHGNLGGGVRFVPTAAWLDMAH
jgi:hypothetical protein